MLRALTNSLSSIIYPQECRVCSGEVDDVGDGVACAACWNETRFFSGKEMLCRKCGAFFAAEAAAVPVSCHKCDEHLYDSSADLLRRSCSTANPSASRARAATGDEGE